MTKAVRITVDGASLLAQEGQSLTAALMMAGVSAIRKSPTGEARGALCAMGSCHECRATVDGVRGVRTCLVPVKEGLRVEREMKLPRLPLEPSPGGEGGDAPQIIETGLAVIGAGPAGLAAACVAAACAASALAALAASADRVLAVSATFPVPAAQIIEWAIPNSSPASSRGRPASCA